MNKKPSYTMYGVNFKGEIEIIFYPECDQDQAVQGISLTNHKPVKWDAYAIECESLESAIFFAKTQIKNPNLLAALS